MQRWLGIVAVSAMFAGLIPGAASAGDIPYSVNLTADEKLSGLIDQDDSSGDINSAKGAATGPVSGNYSVDPANLNAALAGPGQKLEVNLNRRDQQVRARLDACTTPDSCTEGNWVTLWEKP